MTKPSWQLNKAGLLNFWYYDNEEFDFADGKLLLRGNNGSGKSVTMQSFIPVLLDGRKSPDRLDPFGSKARKMEDYLLGEKGVVDREERTGYLYLEYKRKGLEQYLTTGIGLRAKRNSSMDFLGFLILDNRRIGYDLFLYKEEYSPELGKNQKIPLTRVELENRIGEGGKIVRTQREYMELVNKHLFGFENIEDYEELIKLLIQLRSPKLSRDFKPTIIYEILNESLPALSDEELRPLSDTIENMDQTKQQLDQLIKEQKSLNKLCKSYDLYNQKVLLEKAEGYLNIDNELQKLKKKENDLKNNLNKLQEEEITLQSKMQYLRQEDVVLKDEKRELEKHKVFDVEKEKIVLIDNISSEEDKLKEKEKNIRRKKDSEYSLIDSMEKEEEKIVNLEDDINQILADLDYEGTEGQFFSHNLAREEFQLKYPEREFVFDLWKQEANQYYQKLEKILKVLEKLERIKERYKEADWELGEARKKVDLKETEAKKWQQYFEEERENLLTQIHQWLQSNLELVLSNLEIYQTAQFCNGIFEDYSLDQLKGPVNQAYRLKYNRIEEELLRIKQNINNKKEEIKSKEAEIKEWKNKKDPEPERHIDTIKAREELNAQKIPYVPFYQAVEFYDKVTSEQRERLEGAIKEIGLLDALIVPSDYLTKVNKWDKVIKPNPQFLKHTLADFLYPTPVEGVKVEREDIANVLHSILLEDTEDNLPVLKEDGSYKISLLRGHAPTQKVSIYIGQESRRRYQKQMIATLTQELAQLYRDLQDLTKEEEQIKQRKDILEKEYNNFPLTDGLKEIYDTWYNCLIQVNVLKNEVENKNKKVKELLEKFNFIKSELNNLVNGMDLPLTREAYDKAKNNMSLYLKNGSKINVGV